jgi:hypothetical protein
VHDQKALECAFNRVKYHVNVLLVISSLACSVVASEVDHTTPDASSQVALCRALVSVVSALMFCGILALLFGKPNEVLQRHLSQAASDFKTSIFWVIVSISTNCLHVPTPEISPEIVQWDGLFFLLRTVGWIFWVLSKLHLEQ